MLIRRLTAQLGQLRAVWRFTFLQRRLAVLLLTVLWLAPLLTAGSWISTRPAHHRATAQSRAVASDSALWTQWEHVATTTDPHFTLPQTDESLAIDPAFAGYYAAHAGATLLGPALTPALPTILGLVQFFTAGALLQPNAQAQALIKQQQQQPQTQGKSTAHQTTIPQVFGPTTQQVLRDSLYASDGNVAQLAIFHALLSAGSTVHIGGDTGNLSYAALRGALQPSRLVTTPAESEIDPQSRIRSAPNVFIAEGEKGTHSVGHTIPDIFWDYMTSSDIAPDGWVVDFGQPLTEALPLTTIRDGQLHHLTAQAFWNAVLIADNDAPDSTGQPSVQVLDIGRAYLQTFGPPKLDIHADEQVWSTGDTAVLDTVTSGTAKIHVGQAFPFTLAGDTQSVNGAFWYHVHWQTPRNSGDGWVSASALTFTSPGAAPAWASFDVLSPDLAKYLAAQGQNSAAVVYDVTHNQYYTYNPDGQFIMASSAKVPIMLTLLTKLEDQGRGPNDQEMYLLTTMIENSDNDSAQALFEEIGGAPAMDAFMHRVNVPGLWPNPDGWGWSTVSPMAMVRLLTLLQQGKILNAQDRALALNLMRNVESDQQVGVGDTAPQGASVALKDGWVPGPDGLWAMNSSGIITLGGETYIIAVYTQHYGSLDDGWNITRHVCGAVAQSLS
jgi:beta-lactamase class A